MAPSKHVLEFERPIRDLEAKIQEMRELAASQANGEGESLSVEIDGLEQKVAELKSSVYAHLTRWQRVQLARHPERPTTLDYLDRMTTDFVELHGDRQFGDDRAIVGGFGSLDGRTVMFIGHQKGRDTKSNVYRNFGMPNPEGYRKALRLMKLAERLRKPVVTLIDTPGAYPGLEGEERGQAEAIARNLFEMAQLKVPIVCVVIGEGASGGALGIGVGDRILMLENTWYSVISPESCSSILWRSWEYKEQAAEALKLTAPDLIALGIVDGMIPEPLGGAHRDPTAAAESLKQTLLQELDGLAELTPQALVAARIDKFSQMGAYETTPAAPAVNGRARRR